MVSYMTTAETRSNIFLPFDIHTRNILPFIDAQQRFPQAFPISWIKFHPCSLAIDKNSTHIITRSAIIVNIVMAICCHCDVVQLEKPRIENRKILQIQE